MPIVPKTLKLYREKGVRLWGFCQGRHSLIDAGYSKETIREFEDQSGVLQLWEVEDTELLRDIEYWSGKKGVVVRGANHGGGGGLNASFTINEVARPVLQSEDIRAIGHGQQLLKIAGCPHLFHAARVPWFNIPRWKILRDPRDISRGLIDWQPVKKRRMLSLPAPPAPEVDQDALLAMALEEADQLRDQLESERKKRKEMEDYFARMPPAGTA